MLTIVQHTQFYAGNNQISGNLYKDGLDLDLECPSYTRIVLVVVECKSDYELVTRAGACRDNGMERKLLKTTESLITEQCRVRIFN